MIVNSSALATPSGIKLSIDFSFLFNTSLLRIRNAQEIQSRYLSAKDRRPSFSLLFNQAVNVEYLRERISLAHFRSTELIACTLSDGFILQPVNPLSFHFPLAIRLAAGTKGVEGNVVGIINFFNCFRVCRLSYQIFSIISSPNQLCINITKIFGVCTNASIGNVGLPTDVDILLSVSPLVFERLLPISGSTLNLSFSQPLGDPRDLAFLSRNNYLSPPVQGEWRVNEQNHCWAQVLC